MYKVAITTAKLDVLPTKKYIAAHITSQNCTIKHKMHKLRVSVLD